MNNKSYYITDNNELLKLACTYDEDVNINKLQIMVNGSAASLPEKVTIEYFENQTYKVHSVQSIVLAKDKFLTLNIDGLSSNKFRIKFESQYDHPNYPLRINNLRLSTDFSMHNFKTRILTGGFEYDDTENEWSKYLINSDLNGTITPGNHEYWNINGVGSWTSTSPTVAPSQKVIQGGNNTVTDWTYQETTNTAGFRPVLFIDNDHDNTEGSGEVVLDIVPEKETINLNETVTADLVIENISEIAAEDIKLAYDNEKLEFVGFEEVDGMKLVKSIEETENEKLRVIIASKGEANIVNEREVLLKLKFKGIQTGEALVDRMMCRVTDGIAMERNLADEECDKGTITIERLMDVNHSGEFTLLDLGIGARNLFKDPSEPALAIYNTDIVADGEINEDDLLEIGKFMLENPNYETNN
ncbi:cohesin domain-containing protein [Bacillus solimangrovi]|uniref:cohesin domain-containing protein n=1 Tax=Bacillus solimangrovi TaxID=1305675 RepID=UPI001FE20BFB|nr:cohesin domain-containing protein [Bacillus solimangrovi]